MIKFEAHFLLNILCFALQIEIRRYIIFSTVSLFLVGRRTMAKAPVPVTANANIKVPIYLKLQLRRIDSAPTPPLAAVLSVPPGTEKLRNSPQTDKMPWQFQCVECL